MERKKMIGLGMTFAMLIGMTACQQEEIVSSLNPDVVINLPDKLKGARVEQDTLTFINQSSGLTVKVPATGKLSLPDGLYNCFYKASVTYTEAGYEQKGMLRGGLESITVDKTHLSFTMDVHLILDKNDFLIEKIFFTGTLRESGKQYNGDSYVKLYNNTDHVLYADGLAFVESEFVSTDKYDYQPDIRKDTMSVHAIYVVPGDGKKYPVKPGESIVLCDTGIDHRVANPNSFDLSKADFEWYDVSSSPNHMDIDGETVENLDKWYCYTKSFFVLHNRGFRAYAVARIPVDKDSYLRDFFYTYEYLLSTPQGNFPMSQTAYKLPNN